MSGVSLITMVTMGFAVAASKPMIRNSEDGHCHIACLENEICHVQYIVKATITGEQV